ncbi:MAG: hypothetical protein PUC00_10130 [Clostridiales bacterium]|nr:hypothetical protein [Clostridiales bacterium]
MNRRGIVSLLLGICSLPLVLLLLGFLLPAQYGGTYLGEMPEKHRRLNTAQGRRIIVIGGSSVPFALNSPQLEQLLPGWTVVDYGLYAPLGTVTMLDWALEGIREGDLVILSPEQDAQALSCYVDGESILQACDGHFDLLTRLNPTRLEAVAAAFPAFAGKKLHCALWGQPESTGIYTRASFNAYGDIDCPGRERNILPGLRQQNQQISFDPQMLSADFIQEVAAFAQAVRQKGADIVYHFPPMNAAAVSEEALTTVDAYYDFLAKALPMPILGDPHHCILDAEWFYDTNFHLNAAGAIVFTGLLAEDIKVYLRDSSPTALSLPSKPAPRQAVYTGDDSCADCFTYRQEGEGWVIDGLTAQGRQQEALILPTHYQGQPVTGMAADVLKNHTALKALTIQPNIPVLPDGFVQGCIRLRRILLTGEEPSAYSVGDRLMEGASFLIQVPAAALDAYRRNYSWQQYEPWLTSESSDFQGSK